jgi:hypothetical protein
MEMMTYILGRKKLLHSLNKMVIVIILAVGLINISLYFSPATAAAIDRTRITADDTPESGDFIT